MEIAMKLAEIREKIKHYSSRDTRTSGNPNTSDIDRQLSDAGVKRKPDDIPKQDVETRNGNIVSGNVANGSYISSTVETKGQYKIGPAIRPAIVHDSGFSKFPKKDPELNDYWQLFKWRSMLETANALRPDLKDGIEAYRHFLDGEGKAKSFSYERYVSNDDSGRATLRNSILDAQDAVIKLWTAKGKPRNFIFTGPQIPCGAGNQKYNNVNKNFPYPATENWQKAIGAHVIWLSGEVTVTQLKVPNSAPEFSMDMVLHAEDQYNFNPGAKDIATGEPDNENGRFVVVGFAHGYRHTSTLKRNVKWKGFNLGVASSSLKISSR